jgi:hypothetical protein
VFKRPCVEIQTDPPTSGKGETIKREPIKEEKVRRKGTGEYYRIPIP